MRKGISASRGKRVMGRDVKLELRKIAKPISQEKPTKHNAYMMETNVSVGGSVKFLISSNGDFAMLVNVIAVLRLELLQPAYGRFKF